MAIRDWIEKTERTQQSARPDMVSGVQSSAAGRLLFAFGNTSFQYNRIMKRAVQDLANNRGNWKANMGKILYYGAIQNMIFSGLQNALFASMYGDSDDDEKYDIYSDNNLASAIDGVVDNILKGSGVYGAVLSTAKNMAIKWYEMELSGRVSAADLALEATSISPAINRKLQQISKTAKSFVYKQEKEKIKKEGFSLKNPLYSVGANTISVTANVPMDRVLQKIQNLVDAANSDFETWQRIALLAGYNKYNLGIEDKDETPFDPLTPSKRAEFEKYHNQNKSLTEKDYMEMKNITPKEKPAKKKKKTWLNVFNPKSELSKPKDRLTKRQREKFESYHKQNPSLSEDDFIKMMNITPKKEE